MDAISSFTQIQYAFNSENPISLNADRFTTKSKHTFNFRIRHQLAALIFENGCESRVTHQLFDEIPLSDTFAWNNLIQTHLANGELQHVVLTYEQMLLRGVRPDRHTLPRILAVSRRLGCLFFGKQLHGQVLKFGFAPDQYVISALIQLYGKLEGAEAAAKCLFDESVPTQNNSVVSWTLLAGFYVKEDKPKFAIDLFNRMVASGARIDPVALSTAIGACGLLKSLQEGRNAHRLARKCGLETDVLVCNSLLKMYVACGSIRDARSVFNAMPSRDAISWTAMISGYVKNGGFNEGLKLLRQMNAEGIKPDVVAISSILPACARMAAHKHGKEIHGYLLRSGVKINILVQNALTDMYVKSGSIDYASKIFMQMEEKDVVSWTVMILGYSLHGQGEVAVNLFSEMAKNAAIKIDQITYAAVLYACCVAGMVEKGKYYFNQIRSPKVSHCALMVGLVARAGLFDEAKAFIDGRKISGQAEVLQALLDGCRIHQNLSTGKRVIEQLCDLEPLNAENYVLLSNWYAQNAKWDMVEKTRETIKDMGLTPKKAYSWIEFRNKVHVFGTGDVIHPKSESIYSKLKCLMKKVVVEEEEEEGISCSSSDFSLHDVGEEMECIAVGHSEMLAISFGLISKQAGTTIHVTKNLRVCRQCHDSAKAISKIAGCEIVVRDPVCFHHFKNGSCSCGYF